MEDIIAAILEFQYITIIDMLDMGSIEAGVDIIVIVSISDLIARIATLTLVFLLVTSAWVSMIDTIVVILWIVI